MSAKSEGMFKWSVKINVENENCLKWNRENVVGARELHTGTVLILYCEGFVC